MPTQIAIIGLGQTGTTFGLALKDENGSLVRIGHDVKADAAQRAHQMGALDRVQNNLPAAVEEASAVLLCLPLDQTLITLEQIAPALRPGAVVMDTAFSKATVSARAGAVLPQGCSYVGLLPVLNLEPAEGEVGVPDAALLRGAPVYIAAPPGTSSAAVQVAADLIGRAGAAPVFSDISELDGLTAKTVLLPALTAAALLRATALQPGWQEGRKTAAYPYGAATLPLGLVPPASLLAALKGDPDTAARVIDDCIRTLGELRGALGASAGPDEGGEPDGAARYLETCEEERQKWWAGRLTNDWDARPDRPEINRAGLLARLFGIGTKKKKP